MYMGFDFSACSASIDAFTWLYASCLACSGTSSNVMPDLWAAARIMVSAAVLMADSSIASGVFCVSDIYLSSCSKFVCTLCEENPVNQGRRIKTSLVHLWLR